MPQKFYFRFDIKKVVDRSPQLDRALQVLTGNTLLVGYPRDKEVPRREVEGLEDRASSLASQVGAKELTNAALAYLNEFGSPADNIPPRPFLGPGFGSAEPETMGYLQQAANVAMDGDAEGVQKRFHAAGLTAQAGIRAYITQGVPPPLAPLTIRLRRAQGFMGTKPLIHTGQLRTGVNYTIRHRRGRTKITSLDAIEKMAAKTKAEA